jgi:predicted nucleic acid-binding protein
VATGTLVDSNVLLDIFTEDANWLEWSNEALATAAEGGPLYINPVIYAEVSVRFSRVEDLEDALPSAEFRRAALPWAAAFLAGKAFVSYRRNRGAASTPLPDFFIGAHAAVDDLALLTRDARRYRTYFPTVRLLAPET